MRNTKLNIVGDENMPQLTTIFKDIADITLYPGREITKDKLQNADVLLIRSVTTVNQDLLATTPVKFVGSATAGLDHIAPEIIAHKNIGFANAVGANARSVVEYILSCFSYLQINKNINFLASRIGIAGAGNVGSLLAKQLCLLGIEPKVYDPLIRIKYGKQVNTLNEIFDTDIVCLHTPLTRIGPHQTQNMVGKEQLEKLKSGAVVISAGRGGVVQENAVKRAVANNNLFYIADVWNNEPNIDQELMQMATLATPHIAGYSYDSKLAATKMLKDAVCEYFKINLSTKAQEHDSQQSIVASLSKSDEQVIANIILQAFPIQNDHQCMLKAIINNKKTHSFDQLRANYWKRREFDNFDVSGASNPIKKRLLNMGFRAL